MPTEDDVRQRAMTQLGLPLVRQVLRHLAGHGPSTRAELAEACGVHPQAINHAVRRLEPLSLVSVDHPQGQRHGKRVRYLLDHDGLTRTLDALGDYVLGR